MLKFFITNISKDKFLESFSGIARLRFLNYVSRQNLTLLTESLELGSLSENLHLINVNIDENDPDLQLFLRTLQKIQFQDNDLIYINLNDINIEELPELLAGDQRIFIDANQLEQDSFFTDLFNDPDPDSPFHSLQELSVEYQKLALNEIADLVYDRLPNHFLFNHRGESYISISSKEKIKNILDKSHFEIQKIIFDYNIEMNAEIYFGELVFEEYFRDNKLISFLCQNQFSFFDEDLKARAQEEYQYTLQNFLDYSSLDEYSVNTEIAQEFVENISKIFITQFERKLIEINPYLFNIYRDLEQNIKEEFRDLALKKFAEDCSNKVEAKQSLEGIVELLEDQAEDHLNGRRTNQQPYTAVNLSNSNTTEIQNSPLLATLAAPRAAEPPATLSNNGFLR